MADVDLGYAVTLPPRDAIAYFKAKGYQVSWNWWDVWQESHAQAFTVAKATRADVLQSIREEVQKAIDEGRTARDFVRNLTPTLQRLGWWGKQTITHDDGSQEDVTLGTPWRLHNIYRTNLQTAFMAGRYKQQVEDAESRPYWQYVAVLDSRTRPAHRAMHGKVFRHDDPFWDTFYPPNGWGCRCRVRTLSERKLTSQGLAVESSEGRLRDIEVEAGVDKRTGEIITAKVTGIRTRFFDERKGEWREWFMPDVGWSYNPGKAAWAPDKRRWVPDLAKEYERAVGVSSLPALLDKLQARKLDDYIGAGREWVGKIDKAATDGGRPFQAALLDALREVRSIDTPARIEGGGSGASTVKAASQRFPDSWTRKADAFGTLRVRGSKSGRGWAWSAVSFPKGASTRFPGFGVVHPAPGDGYMQVRPGDMANAVHEYGHRLQAALPELQQVFADLHRRRTANDPLERLVDLTHEPYRPSERARKDQYFRPYQGKEYDGEALEVLTMAFQWVLGDKAAEFNAFRQHDPEMLHLALGLLFYFEP